MLAAFLLASVMVSLSISISEVSSEGNGANNGTGNGAGNYTGIGAKSCEIPSEGGCCGNELVLEIFGKTGTDYLRTRVAALYEGTIWTIGSDYEVVSYNGGYIPQELNSYTTKTQTKITIKVANPWEGFIPVCYRANRVTLENVETEYYPRQQIFFATSSFFGSYTVDFTNYEFSANLLRESPIATENASSTYLQIPETLKGRLQGLLNEIGISHFSNAYEKILAIQNYLRSNYIYDKNYTSAPAGRDPVEWFLFEEKRGVCANFNSAFVLLLRVSGIPSRMVAGYAINSNVEYQEVRGSGHAWAEVKFEKLGWVEFDATPSGSCGCQSSAPSPKIPTITEITELSPSAVKGGTFSVKGTVVDERRNPVSGLEVIITIKKNKADETGSFCGKTVVSNGRFSATCDVPVALPVGDYNIIATTIGDQTYKDSESDPVLKVNAETKITAVAPELAVINRSFVVTGQLTEREAETPIQNLQLFLDYTMEGQPKSLVSTTNQTGHAKFSCPPISNYRDTAINYTISFKGVDYYLPSEIQGQIKIQQPSNEETPIQEDNDQTGPQPFDTSPILLASIPSSALAIGGVFLFLRKRKKDASNSKPETITQEAPPTGKTIVNAGLDTIELEIRYPQIVQPLPDVWGVNETLMVEFHLKKNNSPFQGTMSLTFDEERLKDPATNNLGVASLEIQIKEKGIHTFTAEYKGNLTSGSCSAKRNIRIVDYTEEVVNIFNETFAFEKKQGAAIGEETTPREFQDAVISAFNIVDKQPLDQLVSLFEVADYSLYILQREEYEKMFLAALTVKNSSANRNNSG
jgi:transglutaminase-like putative cysteine protease